jgi:hypothetical protein
MRSHRLSASTVLFLILCSISFAALARPPLSPEVGWHDMQPIGARVLLLVPDEFSGFAYSHSHRGLDVRLPLGGQAAYQTELLLRNAFASTAVMPVASEAEAKAMISRGDPDLRQYDFVAVPKFTNMSSYDRGDEYGYEVDMVLELASLGGRGVQKIGGSGESRTPMGAKSSPLESASLALSYAVDAVKDGLEENRGVLSR